MALRCGWCGHNHAEDVSLNDVEQRLSPLFPGVGYLHPACAAEFDGDEGTISEAWMPLQMEALALLDEETT